jgi:hypothetical protein
MTINQRSLCVKASFAAGIGVAGGAAALVSAAAARGGAYPGGAAAFALSSAGPLVAAICGLGLGGILALKASRSGSIELFFLSFWCLSLSLGLAAPVSAWLSAHGAAWAVLAFLERARVFSWALSAFFPFAGGLFAAGLSPTRDGAVLGVAALVSLLFSVIFPLNYDLAGGIVIASVGYTRLALVIKVCFWCLSASCYLSAWFDSRDKAFLVAGAGISAAMVGTWLLGSGPGPIGLAMGSVLAVGGAGLHARTLYRHYLWR